MFRFKAEMGFLLFPISAEQLSNAAIFEKLYKFHVNSYPGNIMKLGLIIPQKKESFKSFTDAIKESEIKFLEKIKINS
jgi:hypothetical protein